MKKDNIQLYFSKVSELMEKMSIVLIMLQSQEKTLETVVHCAGQNGGIGNFRIEFEKYVSGQEVSFFNQKVHLSKLRYLQQVI